MKSKKKRNHKEAEAIDKDITEATEYGEQQCEKRHMDFWDFEVHTLKMTKACWCYLLKRRKLHLDTTVICTAAKEEGTVMFNTPTSEAIKIVQLLREELKKHYHDHKMRRDEYLLSKATLESDAGDEEKAKTIRDIKKAERRNQCY